MTMNGLAEMALETKDFSKAVASKTRGRLGA
jgi:hypothetical protein